MRKLVVFGAVKSFCGKVGAEESPPSGKRHSCRFPHWYHIGESGKSAASPKFALS